MQLKHQLQYHNWPAGGAANLLALAIQVDEGVAGGGDVLSGHTLVHAIDVEVKAAGSIHQETQDCAFRTRVQVGAIVFTNLSRVSRVRV